MLDAQTGDPPLRLAVDLFERLNGGGVRYCHWKSNIRLDKSLAGKTDLDILIAKEDLERFAATAKEFGFRPMINPPEKRYEGLSDHLAMDPSSGGLLHIHLHDRLVLGARVGKDIELPIEPLFWSNLERIGNVPVPAPDLELVVLLLRAMLKAEPERGPTPLDWFPADIVDEVASLYRRRDEKRFAALLGETGLALPAESLLRLAAAIADNHADRHELARAREQVLAVLSPYRRRHDAREWIGRAQRTFFATRWAKANLLERRKRLHETGSCIALVGADGSGKSTHVKELRRWLGWKLICRQEYFGLPKASRGYRFLSGRVQKYTKRAQSSKPGARLFRLLAELSQVARWLWSARVRLHTARRIARLVRKGAIVICDRYPLAELADDRLSMDGPRIRFEFRGRFAGAAALEERWYRSIRRPELIIVLKAGADELRRRKPDLDADAVARKVALVSRIEAGPGIAILDNERAYEEVHRDLRRLIWRHLETAG